MLPIQNLIVSWFKNRIFYTESIFFMCCARLGAWFYWFRALSNEIDILTCIEIEHSCGRRINENWFHAIKRHFPLIPSHYFETKLPVSLISSSFHFSPSSSDTDSFISLAFTSDVAVVDFEQKSINGFKTLTVRASGGNTCNITILCRY